MDKLLASALEIKQRTMVTGLLQRTGSKSPWQILTMLLLSEKASKLTYILTWLQMLNPFLFCPKAILVNSINDISRTSLWFGFYSSLFNHLSTRLANQLLWRSQAWGQKKRNDSTSYDDGHIQRDLSLLPSQFRELDVKITNHNLTVMDFIITLVSKLL